MATQERAAWMTQPPEETASSRWTRDGLTRGGDYNGATLTNGVWVGNGDGALVYAVNGRVEREYTARGGDFYLDGAGNVAYDPDGRNDREYATLPPALVSAITGGSFAGKANLQGNGS